MSAEVVHVHVTVEPDDGRVRYSVRTRGGTPIAVWSMTPEDADVLSDRTHSITTRIYKETNRGRPPTPGQPHSE